MIALKSTFLSAATVSISLPDRLATFDCFGLVNLYLYSGGTAVTTL